MRLSSSSLLAGLLLAPAPAWAQVMLIGYGNSPYNPLCAEACLRSFSSLGLECEAPPSVAPPSQNGSTTDHGEGHGHSRRHTMAATTPDCFANNSPFLTSVAWCVSTRCVDQGGVSDSLIQQHWDYWITGTKGVVRPKWSYAQALAAVNPAPPTVQLERTDMMLNMTSLVPPGTYLAQWNVLGGVVDEAKIESTYGIIIVAITVGLPILLSCLGYLPYMSTMLDKIKPFLVYPSLVGTFQVRPLPFLLGNAPTIGQALFITLLFVLNFALAASTYAARMPSAWYADAWHEISAYVLYRTGTFAFVLFPLVFLFSSRNNVLLWLTNWSHSTYLMLHRWIARILMMYVVVHSVIGLQIYYARANTEWWAWGVVATVLTVFITLGSGLYVRKMNYELFLISHVVLSVLILVGSYYHLTLWYASMYMTYPDTWGYELWLYIAFGVWAFDRVVRVGRVLKAGVRRSFVADVVGGEDGYVRVDVPGVRWSPEPGRHAYVYFPSLLPWRPWENHPFSIIPTSMLQPRQQQQHVTQHSSVTEEERSSGVTDEEKQGAQTSTQSVTANTVSNIVTATTAPPTKDTASGITLFIKKGAGITKYLPGRKSYMTLLDGPYANSTHAPSTILRCDRVLLLGGGIGITGLLPWLHTGHANVKLCWSVKDSARCLIDAVGLSGRSSEECDIRVGSRFDFASLLAEEAAAGWHRIGVVVSGPGSLCDDVRAAVAAAGRKSMGTVFELEVDAYSW
ncbi:ferric-chelate reductase [Microdochium nivale]|nr:ferric-chelate reductase [Microdochium nivale]